MTSVHDGLWSHSRVALTRDATAGASLAEWTTLLGLGIAAALTGLIDLNLRIPGYAVLLPVSPLALGLALVPRRMSGSIMGLTVLGTSAILRFNGWGGGMGSFTSAALLGPFLDAALVRARSGPWIYGGMACGALAANMAAFAVQLAIKLVASGGGGSGGRGLTSWLPIAGITYPLFGILAGLISATIWFRFRAARSGPLPAQRES